MTQLSLSGSCLCGSVQYHLSGEQARFYHCHCERCRKATGTGHASNIILQGDAITWTAGESLLTRYKVPEAKRFAVVFCSVCGGNLPRVSSAAGIVVVPAGSLDGDPGVLPEARIFHDSRAAWSCADPDIPCFPEYPA